MRLRCLALIAGCCAANASAESSLVLYGRVFPVFESTEVHGGGAPAIARTRLADGASRLGVRGTEDLGAGVTAWFRLETSFLASGQSPFADRNSGIGLTFAYGTILMGRWSTPFDTALGGGSGADPFYDAGLPNITTAAMNQGNFARRVANVAQYWTPPGRGWRGRLMYQTSEIRFAGGQYQVFGGSVAHEGESSYFAAAYEKHQDQVRGLPRAGFDEDGYGATAWRRFGPVKLAGHYGHYRATGTTDQASFWLGVQYALPAQAFLASYQRARGGGPLSATAQPECFVWGAGYRYQFSLRTYLLLYYSQANNEVGTLCTLRDPPLPTPLTPGQDLRVLGLGVHTSF